LAILNAEGGLLSDSETADGTKLTLLVTQADGEIACADVKLIRDTETSHVTAVTSDGTLTVNVSVRAGDEDARIGELSSGADVEALEGVAGHVANGDAVIVETRTADRSSGGCGSDEGEEEDGGMFHSTIERNPARRTSNQYLLLGF
jgi:hypothetical protein